MNKKAIRSIGITTLFVASSLAVSCSKGSSQSQTSPVHEHTYVLVPAVDATCTQNGSMAYYTCSGCDELFDTNYNSISLDNTVVSALGHDMTHHDAVAATDCQHDGSIEYWSCSRCEKNFLDSNGGEEATSIVTHGEHIIVDVSAKEPTCAANGNIAYSYCSVCGKYFTADHNDEIDANSVLIPAPGHSFKLVVSGSYRTSYLANETFDEDELSLSAVCEKCNETDYISSYTLEYEHGNCFQYGDSKVVIKVTTFSGSELSSDVAVTVGKLPNAITGLSPVMDIGCKDGIDVSELTADSGNISVKYYSDEATSAEISKDQLIGDNTYYAVARTDGLDANYEVAQYKVQLNVRHNLQTSDSTSCVGYKPESCTKCGQETGYSNVLMSNSDILIGKPEIDNVRAPENVYGMNADLIDRTGSAEGNTGYTYAPTWAVGEEASIKSVKLPRVNYNAYTNVTYKFGTSAASWAQVAIGLNGDADLIPAADYGTQYSFSLIVTKNEGQLNVLCKISNGSESSVTVSADNLADIMSGAANLELKLNSKLYRAVYLRSVYLNDDHSDVSTVASTQVIGYKVNKCNICGDEVGSSTELMNTSDIDYSKSFYGADYILDSGVADPLCVKLGSSLTDPSFQKDNTIFVGHANDGGSYYTGHGNLFHLPRVNYSLYSVVSFPLTASIGYSLGFVSGWDDYNGQNVAYTLTVVNKGENSLKLTLSNDTRADVSIIINDSNVYSGLQGVPMYFGAAEWYTGVYIGTPLFSTDNHSQTSSGAALDKIGYKATTCDLCGQTVSSSSEVMTSADVDYSKSLYGAGLVKNGSVDTSCAIAGEYAGKYATANTVYVGYTSGSYYTGAADEIRLPLVNYSLYSSVSFPITSRGAYNLGLAFAWKDPCESASFVLTITNNGDNNLTLTLSRSGVDDVVKYETSSDVYIGNKGVSIYFGASEGYTGAFIGLPTLTIK